MFIIISVLALIVQLIPVWLFSMLLTFWRFFIEKIFEGGFFKEVVMGVDQLGNSIVGQCFNNSSCIGATLLEGGLSILFIVGIAIPILSFFSIKGIDSEQIYDKTKNVIFLIINILIIISAIVLVLSNRGVLPRF